MLSPKKGKFMIVCGTKPRKNGLYGLIQLRSTSLITDNHMEKLLFQHLIQLECSMLPEFLLRTRNMCFHLDLQELEKL